MLHASSIGWFTQSSNHVHADGRMVSVTVLLEEAFLPPIAQHPILAGEVAVVNLVAMDHTLLTQLLCQQPGILYPTGVMFVAIHHTLLMSALIVACNALPNGISDSYLVSLFGYFYSFYELIMHSIPINCGASSYNGLVI